MISKRIVYLTIGCLVFSFNWKAKHSEYCSASSSFTIQSPVRNPILITGSFGELRNDHFHAGIDLRSSRGVDGDDILSVAKGFLRKVKIEAGSYGKSAYVEHPEGYTTLYAHLLKFREDIEARIKTEQYRNQQFEIEIDFRPEEFPLEAGDMFAYMGNTGASRGTHLHFELRKSGTLEVLDPIEFGLPVTDQSPPVIRSVKVYGFDLDGHLVAEKYYSHQKLSHNHPVLVVPGKMVAFGVNAFDRTHGTGRWVGIKGIQLFIDGGLFYHFSADRWSLEDAKYINAHIDYRSKLNAHGNFHRCFLLEGNKIPLYKSVQNDGLFYIGDDQTHRVKIVVSDAVGNEFATSFAVRSGQLTQKLNNAISERHQVMACSRWNELQNASCRFSFPAGCFYQDVCLKLDSLANHLPQAFSSWYGINPITEPTHHYYEVNIKPGKNIPKHLLDKCFIAFKRGNGYASIGGIWEAGELKSNANQLGYFSIMVDTVPPQITPIVFKQMMPNAAKMVFRVQDNLAAAGKVKALTYDAYIDGQWILMEHDAKTKTITHYFEDWLGKGTHELLIVARDDRGNVARYSNKFIR